MNTQQIHQRFTLFQPPAEHNHPTPQRALQRESAVVLPLLDKAGKAHILLCKRPSHLSHHPGEICLPGGKMDPGDVSLQHTALRELHEELAIEQHQITLIGTLPEHSTLTGFTISPFVGIVKPGTLWQGAPDEVESTFLLPLEALALEQNWQQLSFYRRGRSLKFHGFNTPHGLLWGATARIIRNFTHQLALPV